MYGLNGRRAPALSAGRRAGPACLALVIACGTAGAQECWQGYATTTYPNTAGQVGSIATGDINGDGLTDLVVRNLFGTTTYALFNNGDGTFESHPAGYPGEYNSPPALADLDHDGRDEVIFGADFGSDDDYGNILEYSFGNDGSFSLVSYLTESFYPTGIRFADFDNDGELDLLSMSLPTNESGDFGSPRLAYSQGKGLFDYSGGDRFSFISNLYLRTCDPVDLNNDGLIDAVFQGEYGSTFVFLNAPGGLNTSAANRAEYTFDGAGRCMRMGDVNGDGYADMVVSLDPDWGGTTNTLVVLNNGDGTLGGVFETIPGTNPQEFYLHDVNGDGTLDFTAGPTVYLNDGSGHFGSAQAFLGGQLHAIADMDGDGDEDYVGVVQPGSDIFVAWNDCASACPADFTGDGVLDFFDVSAFLGAYNANDASADLTGDGQFNFFDVSEFLSLYNAGCP